MVLLDLIYFLFNSSLAKGAKIIEPVNENLVKCIFIINK